MRQINDALRDWNEVTLADVTVESRLRNGGQLEDHLLCGVLKTAGLVPMRERVKGNSTDRCKLVPANAFAYNPMRLNIGSIARNKAMHPVMVSPDYVVFEADSQRLLPEYLDHFRYSHSWQNFVGTSGDGSVRVRIYYDHLSQIELPLPPLAEQQKIAAVLTAVDDKLDVIARQIEATQTLKQGLMQTLFNRGVGTQDADGRWVPHTEFKESELGEIPVGWEAAKLNSHVAKVGSGVTPKGGSDSYLSSGIPLIRSQNVLVGRLSLDDVVFISHEQHEKMRNSSLNPNDVLLNITGASIGRSAVLPTEFEVGNVNQHVCIIRTNSTLSPHFLCHYLNSEMGQKQVDKFQAGGNREGLNYQQIRSFDVPLPTVQEQHEIASVLGSFDEKVDVLMAKRERYQTLKRGLMQKLLTGEWRVSVDARATET